MLEVDLLPHGEAHARALVDDQLAAQVGLFLIALDEELLRAAIEFPVDMADGLARVIEAMFGKLNRCSANSTEKPWKGLLCKPVMNPSTI